MAALLKTTEADPTVPAALRADHLSGFDKPARPRRTRPAPAAAQAEVETLLATDPDAAAAALARHVDRFAGNATFLLWASQTFSELAAARPSHGLPDRTLATEAWAALLCTVVLPPGDHPARGRGAAGADADRPLAQDRRRRTAATRGGASAVRPQQGVAHQFAVAARVPVQLLRPAGHPRLRTQPARRGRGRPVSLTTRHSVERRNLTT